LEGQRMKKMKRARQKESTKQNYYDGHQTCATPRGFRSNRTTISILKDAIRLLSSVADLIKQTIGTTLAKSSTKQRKSKADILLKRVTIFSLLFRH